jgi:hypothetical protein
VILLVIALLRRRKPAAVPAAHGDAPQPQSTRLDASPPQ